MSQYGVKRGVHPGHLEVDVPRQHEAELKAQIESWMRAKGIDISRW